MASIFDLFRPAPAPAPASEPNATGTPTAALTPTDTKVDSTTPVIPATPLDQFKGLWETDPTDKAVDTSLFGVVDPKKIFDAAKSANFAGAIPQETLDAIQAGGDGATKALQDALNYTTQAVFAQNTLATTKLIEQAVTKALAQQLDQLPSIIKRHTAADVMQTKNPALSDPAAAPIIAAVQAQLAVKHPNATATQLTELAESYLINFAEVVKPTKLVVEAKGTETGMDWSKFLGA